MARFEVTFECEPEQEGETDQNILDHMTNELADEGARNVQGRIIDGQVG